MGNREFSLRGLASARRAIRDCLHPSHMHHFPGPLLVGYAAADLSHQEDTHADQHAHRAGMVLLPFDMFSARYWNMGA